MAANGGVERIAAERCKQELKWGDEHDDEHDDGALAFRAAELVMRVVRPKRAAAKEVASG
jgi:hypothetical protein